MEEQKHTRGRVGRAAVRKGVVVTCRAGEGKIALESEQQSTERAESWESMGIGAGGPGELSGGA